MPHWFLFTLVAVLCWGVWAVLSKLIGDAVTAAQSQALSALGLTPAMLALGLAKKSAEAGQRRRGAVSAFLAGALTCGGNVTCYHALNSGAKAATVVPLTALYPLVSVPIAIGFPCERITLRETLGIAPALVSVAALAWERPAKAGSDSTEANERNEE